MKGRGGGSEWKDFIVKRFESGDLKRGAGEGREGRERKEKESI